MIKQIKDAIQKMERNKKRSDIYQYLQRQWKLHYDSPQLCVLIMEQMVSFLLELESPWAIPEGVNEYQYYSDFLQEVLQYGMKHHCKNKMFLWQLCYYLAGISTYHFLYGKTIMPGNAVNLLKQYLAQAHALYPDSKLFQLVLLYQRNDTSWKTTMPESTRNSIHTEIAEWDLQTNEVDQELLDLFNFPKLNEMQK